MLGYPRILIAGGITGLLASAAVGDEPRPRADRTPASTAAAESFEKVIRPLLAARCWKCHGPEKSKGGLRLDSAQGLAKGGDSGEVVVPGQPEASLLVQAVRRQGEIKMPPDGRLEDREIAALVAWVKAGARWPEYPRTAAAAAAESARTHDDAWRVPAGEPDPRWALRPVKDPAPPVVRQAGPAPSPLDRFILARLEAKGLSHAPPADKRTLIRRAYFDLIGLPPPPEAIRAFLDDPRPDAYARLIDHLLESPQYGERWGRHWLDVARYADSGGYETDIYYRNAWRYRDYVVKSFNDDKPYDRFVQEQIAGDELWPDDLALDQSFQIPRAKLEHLEARIATGLYTLGTQIHESNMNGRKREYEQLTDWVDTTGSVFLGLTIGCARCHDHKFDPITQRDYYSFQAIFAASREEEIPIVSGMEIADFKQHYPRIIAADEARRACRLFEQRVKGRPLTPAEQHQRRQLREALADAILAIPEKATSAPNDPWDGLMEIPSATVLGHCDPALIPEIRLLNRGELNRPRELMTPDIPAALRRASNYSEPLPGPQGNRKALALWLTRPDHPLTARVMVNRLWLWHFGAGLVATPNDFGKMGQPPSHPELLDWLATQFVRGGWSIKRMHRLIMLSNTYQMASTYQDKAGSAADPDNRFLWRMNRRRLEAEAYWDALHAVAGTLNLKMGGRPIMPPLADEELGAGQRSSWIVPADPSEWTRRGLYILVRRNFVFPMFEIFDSPVNSVSTARRETTNVAPQALWALNNRHVYSQARQFAARLVREVGHSPQAWIDRAWEIALGRRPTAAEVSDARRLLAAFEAHPARPGDDPPPDLAQLPPARAAALTKLCLAILNLNEFIFID